MKFGMASLCPISECKTLSYHETFSSVCGDIFMFTVHHVIWFLYATTDFCGLDADENYLRFFLSLYQKRVEIWKEEERFFFFIFLHLKVDIWKVSSSETLWGWLHDCFLRMIFRSQLCKGAFWWQSCSL